MNEWSNPPKGSQVLECGAGPVASIRIRPVRYGFASGGMFPVAMGSDYLGRMASLLVTHGKTAAARRVLPMTPRVRNILETRWEAAGKPAEGLDMGCPTRSGHVESSSLKKQHARAFRILAEEAAKNNEKPIRPFVLYSLRHTFLTRLGESGCDAWTLAGIAGHSNVSMSSRYVHPSEDAVLTAMARLGGHKIGHSQYRASSEAIEQQRITQ